MNQKLAKCAIAGGLVVFVWLMFSWMVLPWHQNSLSAFSNDRQVASSILQNAPADGIYVHPQMDQPAVKEGARVFAVVRTGNAQQRMTVPLVRSAIIQVIGAFLICWMLMKTKGLDFMQKVWFVTVGGLFAGVVSALPAANWFGFPIGWSVVQIADLGIGWFFGGLTIAKVSEMK